MKKLTDRVIFLILCVVILTLFVLWKGCDLKMGTPGLGLPGGGQGQGWAPNGTTQENKDDSSDTQLVTPSIKLYLGRQGISEDQVTWHDMDQFADYIKQLQEKGIKEVRYTLLPDSIERYEKKWEEELKKANLRSYTENN